MLLCLEYLLGPKPDTPQYNTSIPIIPAQLPLLEAFVKDSEARHKLKPGNQAKIIWANDSVKEKTGYAIVYLHGFSASHEEGSPIHTNVAQGFGCNLYLSRLAEQGIDTTEPMANLTADNTGSRPTGAGDWQPTG